MGGGSFWMRRNARSLVRKVVSSALGLGFDMTGLEPIRQHPSLSVQIYPLRIGTTT
jgi:hypothetical protein